MSEEVWIGSTRTGKLIQKLNVAGETNFRISIHRDGAAEVIVPLDEIPSLYKSNLGGFLKDNERFLVSMDSSFTNGQKVHAFPILNLAVDEDAANVTSHCGDIAAVLSRVPALPPEKRARIASDADVWTVTGTPSQIVTQVLSTATTETGNYRFPQSIEAATGGGTTTITHVFNLSELVSVKDFLDDLAASYEGFETVFESRLISGSEPRVVWTPVVGAPHYRKTEEPLSLNIDAKGAGRTTFSNTQNGSERTNWWWVTSGTTSETDPNFIDLNSAVKAPPAGDEEFLTLSGKEMFSGPLTDEELTAQRTARMSTTDTRMETYTVGVFDEDFKYSKNLGRRLTVTASKRLTGLNKELRIVAVEWEFKNPSSVNITVQPAALKIFPKVPNRSSGLKDLVKDVADKAIKDAKWKEPKPPKPKELEPIVDDWDAPGTFDKPYPSASDLLKSPLTKMQWVSNEVTQNFSGTGGYLVQLTSKMWGDDFGVSGRGNATVAGSTTIPNTTQRRFYGASWDAQVLVHDGSPRLAPWKLELFHTRKFDQFPTWGPNESGNYPNITDENLGVSSTGGKIGELTTAQIEADMLAADGPGVLKWERLAMGSFFRGKGATEKLVVYIHQLQIYDDGKTFIRSGGMAWETSVNQEFGFLEGGWTRTQYPFTSANEERSYYPMTTQVAVYGPDNSIVTCLTPASYFSNSEVDVSYPLIVTNTYWTEIQQGRYAIENISLTKNFRTGKSYDGPGVSVTVFQAKFDTEEKWSEAYQLLSYGGELWATNMTYSSYFSNIAWKSGGGHYALRFMLKSKTDRDGKPIEWKILAAQYGYGVEDRAQGSEDYYLWLTSLVGIKDVVFSGSISPGDIEIPAPHTTAVIGGKVGAESAKVLYGVLADQISLSFWVTNAASGYFGQPDEFFPDFYGFSLHEGTPVRSGDKKWAKHPERGHILPIWNGTADNNLSNEAIHGISTLKGLNVGDWIVLPSATSSYLLGSDGGGRNGAFVYYD